MSDFNRCKRNHTDINKIDPYSTDHIYRNQMQSPQEFSAAANALAVNYDKLMLENQTLKMELLRLRNDQIIKEQIECKVKIKFFDILV